MIGFVVHRYLSLRIENHAPHTEHFALTPAELKTIILEGVKRSFFGGSYLQKRAYVKRFLHYYEERTTLTESPSIAFDPIGRTSSTHL
jgi:hypothetical protein